MVSHMSAAMAFCGGLAHAGVDGRMGPSLGELLLAVVDAGVFDALVEIRKLQEGGVGVVGIDGTDDPFHGMDRFVHIGAAGESAPDVLLFGGHALDGLGGHGVQLRLRLKLGGLPDELQGLLAAVVQIFRPDGAGGFDPRPLAAHEQDHPGLFAPADPIQNLL